MDDSKNWANLYEQEHNTINGRNIWLYLLHTAIGNFWVIEYEQVTKEITSKVIKYDTEKAYRYFNSVCHKILKGTL